jgi:hypothetical protein
MPLAFVAGVGPENMTENIFDSCRRNRRLFYWVLAIVLCPAVARAAPPAMTTVTDIVYRADGTPAAGTLIISWPAFSTVEALLNGDIADERKFNEGVSKIIDGVVQCLNASPWSKML